MVESTLRRKIELVFVDLPRVEATLGKTILSHPNNSTFPNNLYRIPIRTPFTNTITPLAIYFMYPSEIQCTDQHHSSCWHISSFLSNLKYVTHLEGFYSFHPTISAEMLPIQQFWLSSSPPRTHIPLCISHIHITILYEVSYEKMFLSQQPNILNRLCTG
jgi:hypothetical protein